MRAFKFGTSILAHDSSLASLRLPSHSFAAARLASGPEASALSSDSSSPARDPRRAPRQHQHLHTGTQLGLATALFAVLGSGSAMASSSAAAPPEAVSSSSVLDLPTDKLRCSKPSHRPTSPGGGQPRQVAILGCGSYNPPTMMHLRMFELAREALHRAGQDVVGAYMSPVSDAYGKKGLAPATHRLAMCRVAVEESEFVMVDEWEAKDPGYKTTLKVLERVRGQLNPVGPKGPPPSPIRVVLLCGADMLASFLVPGVWKEDDMREIFTQHGVVCVCRDGTDIEEVMGRPGNILNEYRDRILVVRDPFVNNISSSLVRRCLEEGRTVKYVVPDPVLQYISEQRLYRF